MSMQQDADKSSTTPLGNGPGSAPSLGFGRIDPGNLRGRRLPLAFVEHAMEPKLLAYLSEAPELATPESALESIGFSKCLDYPQFYDTHIYYEGYFHALQSAGNRPYVSLNPRTGVEFPKPAASSRIRAFIEAVRRRNTEGIVAALEVAATNAEIEGAGRLSWVIDMLRSGHHFADLAIQHHYGVEVAGDHLGWHMDAPNSVLHLAVGMRGTRVLHTMVAEKPAGYSKPRHCTALQVPGQVYLSSPFAFSHAVEYPETAGFAERICAIQCRFLLSRDQADHVGCERQPWFDVASAVQKAIKTVPLQLPRFADVIEIETELTTASPQ